MWGRGAILAIIWSRMSMPGFSYGCLAWKRGSVWMKVMPRATFPWTFHCLRFSSSDKNMFWLGVVKRNLILSANSPSDRTKRWSLVEERGATIKTGTQTEREAKCLQVIFCNFSKKFRLKAMTLLIPPVLFSSLSHFQELLVQAGPLCCIAVGEGSVYNLMCGNGGFFKSI